MSEFALEMRNIVKEFPGVRALDDASLSIRSGEVHGLVGENGAGKSTIIKVLAGIYTPESGQVDVSGSPLPKGFGPQIVHDAGIRFIHQELHLVPYFTVAESVYMAQEASSWSGLKTREMRKKTEEFLKEKLAVDISGKKLIRDLSTAERKLVQIARALIDNQAKIVVFDEPTAPLASGEVETLMQAIAQLKASGISILYVSHYLDEITDICDRVTVFRQGSNVAVFDTITKDSGEKLVSAMVGRDLGSLYPESNRVPGEPVFELKGFGDGDHFRNINLSVRKGQILGIAGLIGSGREELIDCIYGLRRAPKGDMLLDGKKITVHSAAQAVRNGIVLVPRDRRQDGLVLPMTITENVTLATLDKVSSFGIEKRASSRDAAIKQIEDLDIRTPNENTVVRLLSGGNQQKVVLGRWLAKDARVFILDEPTVGVDVGARVEIYQLIEQLAANGTTVIVSSSDPAELIGISDRIAVMMRGEITHEISTEDLTVDKLVAITTGAIKAEEQAYAS
ncbi:sugar ABC transporter ATP-binding protein [uncultured Cohaesibacter sp.]|uniref:sugar ABC transporter ATP-binding protein n=1 Tax=uncultured Cohaesibacter sp. TaxID=1002546 RepID=UPI0029C73114|nr:sugar ABC transporter ATP-binding protein [uncultured Cohaesibacter sp.]